MAEFTDDVFERSFDRFHAEVAPMVRPSDVAGLRAALRRRQRTRVGIAAFASVLAVVVPVTWYAASTRAVGPPNVPGTATPTEPASPSSEPSSLEPSASPEPSIDPSPPPGALDNATVPLPPWPAGVNCPSGPITFAGGVHLLPVDTGLSILIRHPVDANLDADPALELAVTVMCFGPGEGGTSSVIALERAGSAYHTLGTVISTGPGFELIGELAGTADGVQIEVGDINYGSAPPSYATLWQWRTYRWNGSSYLQTAGSRSFVVDPAVATVTATVGQLVVGAATTSVGPRYDPGATPGWHCALATISITLHNAGPNRAELISAAMIVSGLPEDGVCPDVSGVHMGYDSALVDLGELAAGASRTVTVTVPAWAYLNGPTVVDEAYNYVDLRVRDQKVPGRQHLVVRYPAGAASS
jgi:hypothetical protein